MDIGCVTIVILAQTKTNAETKKITSGKELNLEWN